MKPQRTVATAGSKMAAKQTGSATELVLAFPPVEAAKNAESTLL